MISGRSDVESALRETARVVKPGAQALLSVVHPWGDGWQGDYLAQQVVRVPMQDEWRGKTLLEFYPPRYHRPLADYVTMLHESGLPVVQCEEIMCEGSPLAVVFAAQRAG